MYWVVATVSWVVARWFLWYSRWLLWYSWSNNFFLRFQFSEIKYAITSRPFTRKYTARYPRMHLTPTGSNRSEIFKQVKSCNCLLYVTLLSFSFLILIFLFFFCR